MWRFLKKPIDFVAILTKGFINYLNCEKLSIGTNMTTSDFKKRQILEIREI